VSYAYLKAKQRKRKTGAEREVGYITAKGESYAYAIYVYVSYLQFRSTL
jgi:hypothetical protein